MVSLSSAHQSLVCKFARYCRWMRMLTLFCVPDKRQCVCVLKVLREQHFLILYSLPRYPPCHCASPEEKHQRLLQQYCFLKEADLLTHVWWKRITHSSLGRLYLLYFSLCVWYLVAMVPWESWPRLCDGVVTQRFFMASGMGWLWTHYNGKWGLLIHTVTGCWGSGGDSSRRRRSKHRHLRLTICWLFVGVLGYSSRVWQNTQQQVGPSLQFSWLDTPV